MINFDDKEKLEDLVLTKKLSYEEIGVIFNVCKETVRKKTKLFGIKVPRRRILKEKKIYLTNITDEDFYDIIKNNNYWVDVIKQLGYKYSYRKKLLKDKIKERCDELNIDFSHLKIKESNKSDFVNTTKKNIFDDRKNWQSARSSIQKNARNIFFKENKTPKCYICGYDKHVEVAHIKSVSSFTDESLISEINSIDNLIGLCPNHHWEYDKGILDLKEKN